MSPEVLAYPFLFIAIFFESFVLVTFLSSPARSARRRSASDKTPTVAIIVPCYNEESTVAATAKSLLALEYPKDKLEIILVDDGSKDGTPAAMAAFENHPQVKIIRKENGGKHTALNAGIAATAAEIVGCLDADSFVDRDALKEIIACFDAPAVAAATAAMSVHEPRRIIEYVQYMEYFFSITLRHTLASVNGLYVTPGPFSLYRRAVIEELGGFRYGYQTEDMEMALRIQRAGYHIENAPRARAYTKVPASVPALITQRTRWISGFLRNMRYDYHDLIFNARNEALGMIVLPLGIFAIGGGIMLFLLMISMALYRAVHAYFVYRGIPFSFASWYHLPALDWFYIPATLYVLLIVIMIGLTLFMIIVGKRISKTPGPVVRGIIPYLFLYGFIAPLWLIRATADVIANKKRLWR